jgi:uncharacterized membrane protein YccC
MRATLRHLFSSILNVDPSRFDGLAALRCTAGVAVPLILGAAWGSPTTAVFGTVGAFGVGFGSFQGAYRSQAIPMLLAAVDMAVSVLVGSLAGHAALPAFVFVGLWGFGGGLLVALGQSASFVGLQSIVAAVIAAGFPSDPTGALLRGAVVLGGGLVQTLLVVSIWPLRRFTAERRSLSEVYRSLAEYAAAIPRQDVAPEPHTLAGTRSPLADPQPFARPGQTLAFQALLDEAERLRASLAALALHRDRLRHSDRACTGSISELTARVLEELADALAQGREPRPLPGVAAAMDDCAARLSPVLTIEPLLLQLRSAWRTAALLASDPGGTVAGTDRVERPRRRRSLVRDALVTLRANLSRDSTAFRHALRLGVSLVAAEVIARVFEIPRGYWLPLTVAVMLKPEFTDTASASLGRVGGTVLGAAAAMGIAHTIGPGVPVVAIVLAFVWASYALAGVNAVAFFVSITAYVVFLMSLRGVPEASAAVERILNTTIAGLLAVGAYLSWPTWTARGVRTALGTMLDQQADYLEALLVAYATGDADAKALDELRSRARRARSNAEALVDRTLAEPYWRAPLPARTLVGLLAANRRVALAALAIRAGLQRERPLLPREAIEPLAHDIARSLRRLAERLRDGWTPSEPLSDLAARLAAISGDDLLRDEITVMVDGIETMADLLADRQAHG